MSSGNRHSIQALLNFRPEYANLVATEKYSGKVSAAIDITNLIGKDVAEAGALSTRNPTEEHKAMVEQVVTEITANNITKGDVTKLKVSLHPLME